MPKVLERTYRAPEGKTLRVAMRISNCRIIGIEITGDFFLYPENVLEELERKLYMCASSDCIDKAIEDAASKATPLGFSWSTLKNILIELLTEGCRDE